MIRKPLGRGLGALIESTAFESTAPKVADRARQHLDHDGVRRRESRLANFSRASTSTRSGSPS